jgi:membrane fusion protein, multidrug efflux system
MDDRVDRTGASRADQPASQAVPRRRRRLVLPIVAAVVLALGLWYFLSHREAPKTAAPAAQPVGAATIASGPIRIILNELGTVTPLDTVTVLTQINGQLTQVAFQEGQVVKKGDFLAQIDDRTYRAQLQHDQGQLAHDQGLLAQAKSDLQRYETLAKQNSIAQQQAVDQEFLVQQDQGTVLADQGTVATDETNITYCHIVSPIDGRVGLRLVDQGNYIQTSNTTGIAVIAQLQPMSVIFTVPQQEVAAVDQRMASGATLAVSVYDQTNTAQIDQGKLSVIDNEMNTATGTVNLRAVFPNAKNQLFPNEFVSARLLVDTLANVVRVPVAAVQVGENGNFVWAIGSDGTVSAATVKLGAVDRQFQQVVSGLQAGDRVVTDGTDRLQAGTHVTVEAPPQTPQPAPQQPAQPAQQQQQPPAQPPPQPAPP